MSGVLSVLRQHYNSPPNLGIYWCKATNGGGGRDKSSENRPIELGGEGIADLISSRADEPKCGWSTICHLITTNKRNDQMAKNGKSANSAEGGGGNGGGDKHQLMEELVNKQNELLRQREFNGSMKWETKRSDWIDGKNGE